MTDIKKICEEILGAYDSTKKFHVGDGLPAHIDLHLYNICITNADKLAKACLVMLDTLNGITGHIPRCEEFEQDLGCCYDAKASDKALKEVENIFSQSNDA